PGELGPRALRAGQVGVAVGPDDDVGGAHRAARGGHYPLAAAPPRCPGHRALVEARARLLRGAGESARVAERLHDAAAMVDEAADVGVGAGELGDPDAIDRLDRAVPPAPLLRGVAGRAQGRLGVARLDPAVLTGVALDAVAPHQVEDEVRGAPDQIGQPGAPLRSELRLELARIELEARDHLP